MSNYSYLLVPQQSINLVLYFVSEYIIHGPNEFKEYNYYDW